MTETLRKFVPLWVRPNPRTKMPFLPGERNSKGKIFWSYSPEKGPSANFLDPDEVPHNPSTGQPYSFGECIGNQGVFWGFVRQKGQKTRLPVLVNPNAATGRPYLPGDKDQQGNVFRNYVVSVREQGVPRYHERWEKSSDLPINELTGRHFVFGDDDGSGLVFLRFKVLSQKAEHENERLRDAVAEPLPWTPERTRKLIDLWYAGYSAKKIGDALGGKSRNAVISKIRRLGVPSRDEFTQQEHIGPEISKEPGEFGHRSLGEPQIETNAGQSVQRPGQQQFRNEILALFEETCAVTGTKAKEVLEAAHIIPYSVSHDHDHSNGLCLRADIHSLFDLGLISVSEDWFVTVSSRLSDEEYVKLDGVQLNLPIRAKIVLKKEHLRWHRKYVFS